MMRIARITVIGTHNSPHQFSVFVLDVVFMVRRRPDVMEVIQTRWAVR